MKEIICNSVLEMYDFAKELADTLKGGETIFLYGEMGSGKTTFVRGLNEALDGTDRVTSPTFAIINEYKNARIKLIHVDLYRLSSAYDIEDTGIYEYMCNKDYITVIEWSEVFENGEDKIDCKKIKLSFEYVDENKRKISFI